MLNKMTVSELAQLSKLSKAYISQVKNGKRPPSKKLIQSLVLDRLPKPNTKDYFTLFINSRKAIGVSPKTIIYYKDRLGKYIAEVDYLKASKREIERHLNSIPPNKYGLATRHASYRCIKTFYKWLNSEYQLSNPIEGMSAPILGKPILPTLTQTQVFQLIEQTDKLRDKAVIALLAESGLRRSELANIEESDIDWQNHTIKILGKGRKEAYAPFGTLSEQYLNKWLAQHTPNGNIWGTNDFGIQTMLRRLEGKTGIKCNAHTFRRTFACLLRKAGVDTMTIVTGHPNATTQGQFICRHLEQVI